MRIDRIHLRDHSPIKSFEIAVTSNIVIIAGANGSGKTRLKEALVNSFRSPKRPQASLSLTATQQEERDIWKTPTLEVKAGEDCAILREYLATRSRVQVYSGTVVQIDSDRAVRSVNFETFNLATEDPDDQAVDYNWYLSLFTDRWQQLVNKIYKKAAARDQKITKFVKADPSKPGSEALAAHPDPFLSYQSVFSQLLPGKTLEPIDPRTPREFHYRIGSSEPLPFSTLSSGEQEVVKVAFTLVWKKMTHSIIMIDEPELHLHPTLAFRLIETLKGFGGGTNQLFLFTHSADLISTYYSTGNVFFIDSGSAAPPNQAHQLSGLATAHGAVARAAGANLGLFAVGKRLVFVEGREASVDRLVYHKVAQIAFPDSYIMPIGSVENIIALKSVIDELTNAIFGIDLFLVRDRDGLSDSVITSLQSNRRFRCLTRRHIENYLLDEDVLSNVATALYLAEEKRDANRIRNAIKDIASSILMTAVLWNVREQIRALGALNQPKVHGIEQMSRDDLATKLSEEVERELTGISGALNASELRKLVINEHTKLTAALSSDGWMKLFPGKIIFNRFCGEVFQVESASVREAYTDIAMRTKREVFQDIIEILEGFSQIAAPITN
jgi:energy-coupling factor transporter ATP-binding protein EcfA2